MIRKRVFGPGEATSFVAGGRGATDDDVSVTNDGRRLDNAEAVIEFFEDMRREQAQAQLTVPSEVFDELLEMRDAPRPLAPSLENALREPRYKSR